MALQSTIDRINDAVIALGQQKDLLLRGNAQQPDPSDVFAARGRVRIVCKALDTIGIEYDATDFSFEDAVDDVGFDRAADRADERHALRGLCCLNDEDFDR